MKQLIFFAFISICLSSTVFAEEGFYTPDTLPVKKPENFQKFWDASVGLGIPVINASYCSGAFISNTGYYLTAAHCVFECLQQNKLLSTITSKGSNAYGEPDWQVDSVKERKPKNVSCLDAGLVGLQTKEWIQGRLVYVGGGAFSFDDNTLHKVPADVFTKMLNVGSDYAILKFDLEKVSLKVPACLSISKDAPKTGDRVFMAGYPQETNRPGGNNSDGVNKFLSYGSVVASPKNYGDKVKKAKLTPSEQKTLEARLVKLYSSASFSVSNMDNIMGDSGASVVNQQGELTGVFVSGALSSSEMAKTKYYDSTALSTSIVQILKEMKANGLSQQEIDEYFNCQ